jgi:hypothetical protein
MFEGRIYHGGRLCARWKFDSLEHAKWFLSFFRRCQRVIVRGEGARGEANV